MGINVKKEQTQCIFMLCVYHCVIFGLYLFVASVSVVYSFLTLTSSVNDNSQAACCLLNYFSVQMVTYSDDMSDE